MAITVNKSFNIWTVAAVVASTAFAWGINYASMRSADASNAKDVAGIQEDVKLIKDKLPAIDKLQYRQDTLEDKVSQSNTKLDATNARFDKFVDTIGGKLDNIVETMNKVATKVEVISAQTERKQSDGSTLSR